MTPGGLRIGAPALTSRGFVEKDFEQVESVLNEICKENNITDECLILYKMVEYFSRAVDIALEAKKKTNKLKDYREFLENDESIKQKMAELKKEVNSFAIQFPMPGFDGH